MTNIAHIVMQKKGGAGKTTVSVQLAVALQKAKILEGRKLKLFDTDPSNKSFHDFKSLPVSHVDILDENEDIDKAKFDELFNDFLEGSHDMLIDTGSSNFHQLYSFMKLSKIVEVAKYYNKNIIFHVPINFDGSYIDTCESLASIASTFKEAGVVVWANANNTKMSQIKDISKTQYFNENKNILGVVTIAYMDTNLEGADFRRMMSNHQTYDDVTPQNGWKVLNKIRLDEVFKGIASQVELLLPIIYGLPDITDGAGANSQEDIEGQTATAEVETQTAHTTTTHVAVANPTNPLG